MHINLSIISVNYNGLKDTLEMLESIYTHIVDMEYEVIVVDNGSIIDESKLIKAKYPQVIVLRSEKNRGFAGGNNLGIEIAKGKYILLLNNDTILTDNSLFHLVKRAESGDNIAIVSPKICFHFGDQRIQFAGYTALSRVTLRNRLIGFGEIDKGLYDNASTTPYAHGAAMLIKREVIKKVGLMPELFFLYYEELDWSANIIKHGYEIWYEPLCRVLHKESQSTGQDSPLKLYYLTRNRLLFAWRNLGKIERILSIMYQVCIANNIKLFNCLRRGQNNHLSAIVKGELDFFLMKFNN